MFWNFSVLDAVFRITSYSPIDRFLNCISVYLGTPLQLAAGLPATHTYSDRHR
jgi:hypothetical protein